MLLRAKGYVTVYLSLTVMIMLSLILALFQGARIGAAKMKAQCVADISMNSVLGEYSRDLFDQYGLLMVDSSYGSGNHSVTNTQEHLREYVQKNFDRSIAGRLKNAQTMTAMQCKDARLAGYTLATDNGAAALKRQIVLYMTADPLMNGLSDVADNVGLLTGNGFDSTDVDRLSDENQERIDSVELPTVVDENGEEYELSVGNPADEVNSQRHIGALNLAIKDKSKISTARVDLSQYVSHRKKTKGTGLNDDFSPSAAQKLLMEEYYYEKCSRYGAELEKSKLKYQLEYLIFGNDSDYKNLEKMAQTLLFWRQASNMMYLFGNSTKVHEAEIMATALSIIMWVPELAEPLKYSILFAWTFAESISDLSILFSGGKVPLIKSDSTWKLSLSNMFNFRDHLSEGGNDQGLEYKDYLRMKLFMTDSDTKTDRFMDVVEMDVRQTTGNSGFKLDYCIDTIWAEIEIGTKYGFNTKIEKVYGYEN